MKTPITAIGLELQFLSLGDICETTMKTGIERANRQLAKMLDAIHSVNNYSKVDYTDYTPRLQNADVIMQIKNTVDCLKVTTESKKIAVSFMLNVPEKVMPIDVVMIDRIMTNLLSNAAKFTPENGEIDIKVEAKEKEVVVSVSDNGIGFPKEMLAEGIKRYDTKVDEMNPNGWGMGISIVKEMMEKLKGSVEFRNGLNGGAEVVFILPVQEIDEDDCDKGIQIKLM